MLAIEQYQEMRKRIDTYEAWCKTLPNGGSCISAEVLSRAPCSVSNDERSAVEVYEFVRDKPDRYFIYVDCCKNIATTWTGESLGSISFGKAFRDNFGGMRVPITVRAITGETYYGYYFKTAGDYGRIKKAKRHAAA